MNYPDVNKLSQRVESFLAAYGWCLLLKVVKYANIANMQTNEKNGE